MTGIWRKNRTVLAVVCLCLALLGLDAVLRFGLGIGNPILVASDPSCGYTLKPGQDVRRLFRHTRVNRLGMRSEEVEAKGNALRILFLGDSLTYGITRLDQHDLFTDILRRELPASTGRPVQVLNASAGAWAIGNEVAYVKSRGILNSDAVLLVLNSDDLTQQFASVDESDNATQVARPFPAFAELYARFVKPRLKAGSAPRDAEDAAQAAAETVRQNIASLGTLLRSVREQGATLTLIYIPFRADITDGVIASEPPVLIQWAAVNHVPSLDLTHTPSVYGTREVTLDGMHLNAKGNRIVAEAIRQQWQSIVPGPSSAGLQTEHK